MKKITLQIKIPLSSHAIQHNKNKIVNGFDLILIHTVQAITKNHI